jgi:hypothetical protein
LMAGWGKHAAKNAVKQLVWTSSTAILIQVLITTS